MISKSRVNLLKLLSILGVNLKSLPFEIGKYKYLQNIGSVKFTKVDILAPRKWQKNEILHIHESVKVTRMDILGPRN